MLNMKTKTIKYVGQQSGVLREFTFLDTLVAFSNNISQGTPTGSLSKDKRIRIELPINQYIEVADDARTAEVLLQDKGIIVEASKEVANIKEVYVDTNRITELEKANAELEQANAELKKANAELKKANAELEKASK